MRVFADVLRAPLLQKTGKISKLVHRLLDAGNS